MIPIVGHEQKIKARPKKSSKIRATRVQIPLTESHRRIRSDHCWALTLCPVQKTPDRLSRAINRVPVYNIQIGNTRKRVLDAPSGRLIFLFVSVFPGSSRFPVGPDWPGELPSETPWTATIFGLLSCERPLTENINSFKLKISAPIEIYDYRNLDKGR
jgi:hypothetical protein